MRFHRNKNMTSPINAIVIGDLHFETKNILEVDEFSEKLLEEVCRRNPDFIVLLGDVLDTHERLHMIPLNKATGLIDRLSKIAETIVLVGNHDMMNNKVFLTDDHWMNSMKKWHNVTVVDVVTTKRINDEIFMFCPYVFDGKFEEALLTSDVDFRDVKCIFAHQEIRGCKMEAKVSVNGDFWPLEYPHIISGHIHSNQRPQKNVYYPGVAIQRAYGDSSKNIIASVNFFKDMNDYQNEEIDLGLRRKRLIHKTIEEMKTFILKKSADEIQLTITGTKAEVEAFKNTTKYEELLSMGIIVKLKREGNVIERKSKDKNDFIDFRSILSGMINEEKDPYLCEVYEYVVNNKEIDADSIMFL